ncbi:MAG: hypothetical protein WCF79_24340, partial [Rhodomicrobium sp.]
NPSYTMHLVRECRRRGKFRPRLGPEGSDHTDLINLVATGEGIMLEAQFLFEEAMARLRSASLAARVVARRVGFPLVELVAAWSKAQARRLASSGATLSIALAVHRKLKNDLRRHSIKEIGSCATIFELEGSRREKRKFFVASLAEVAQRVQRAAFHHRAQTSASTYNFEASSMNCW